MADINNLTDMSAAALTSGSVIQSSEHNTWREALQRSVNYANDVLKLHEVNSSGASAPTAAADGKVWYDTGEKLHFARQDSAWNLFASDGMTTTFAFGDGLTVASNFAVAGTTVIDGTLTVSGAADFGSSVSMAAGLEVVSNAAVGGTTVLDGTLTVSGAATFSGNIIGQDTSKNLIINGDFNIWQRGTSFAPDAVTASVFSADRWLAVRGAANSTFARSATAPAGFLYSAKVQRDVSDTSTENIIISYAAEIRDSIPYQSQTAYISFWAKAGANFSAASSQLRTFAATGTTGDETILTMGTWGGLATLTNTLTVITTSWVKYTISLGTLDSDIKQIGVQFLFTPVGTAGADDSFYVTGAQIERGIVATDFEHLPISEQYSRCERYYCTSYNEGWTTRDTEPGRQRFDVSGIGSNTYGFQTTVVFKTKMRGVPNVSTYDNGGTVGEVEVVSGTSTAATISLQGEHSFCVVGQDTTAATNRYLEFHYVAEKELA